MWIVKSINNSCALARDNDGRDVVVFGKGIGYRRAPYELDDLSRVSRTFYGVTPAQAAMLKEIPDELVELSSDICDLARAQLGVKLNPNASIVLADHIAFALSRVAQGIDLETPLAHDIRHLFPRETNIGRTAVGIIERRLGVDLPEAEAANIALHIIDAEVEHGDVDDARTATVVVHDVSRIVETKLGCELDTEGIAYARFVMHLRYLVARVTAGTHRDDGMAPMLATMQDAYPLSASITSDIIDYFRETWAWTCDESEALYLLIHVQRLKSALEEKQ